MPRYHWLKKIDQVHWYCLHFVVFFSIKHGKNKDFYSYIYALVTLDTANDHVHWYCLTVILVNEQSKDISCDQKDQKYWAKYLQQVIH